MGFAGRDLVSINDFTNEEIEAVLYLADEMNSALEKGKTLDICKGKDLATLFYEPSTRTRGSFERAMHKLGGTVVSFAEAETASSAAKGETIADTVRVLESYADIIVLRHPREGAAKVAADYARVPIINAGDGGHEHPTQTLCDLYTLKKEKGKIKGLTVCLWGDLKYGRTVHSLIYALVRFGANVFCAPPLPDLDLPAGVLWKLRSEYNYAPIRVKPDGLKSMIGEADAIYIVPFPPIQYSLWSDSQVPSSLEVSIREVIGKADAIYVTRFQTERRTKPGELESKITYPVMNGNLLKEFKKETLVMHPLPRMNELPYDLDNYSRSVYFQQAAYGVPIRMALIALLSGAIDLEVSKGEASIRKMPCEGYREVVGVECENPNCVSQSTSERRYISPEFMVVSREPLALRCMYCEQEIQPHYIASSKWHHHTLENKRYHRADSFIMRQIKPENLIIFGSQLQAQERGYKPDRYVQAAPRGDK